MKAIIKAIEAYEEQTRRLAHFLVVNRKDISAQLREERQRKRISLRTMAKTLGISAPYLSDVELGRRNISSSLLEKLRKLK